MPLSSFQKQAAAVLSITGAITAGVALGVKASESTDSQAFTDSTSPAPTITTPPLFAHLDPFTVTISDGDIERILHVGLTLEVPTAQAKQQVEAYLPIVRSRFLLILSGQNPADIQTSTGRESLAHALLSAARLPLGTGTVLDVSNTLFNTLVMQ